MYLWGNEPSDYRVLLGKSLNAWVTFFLGWCLWGGDAGPWQILIVVYPMFAYPKFVCLLVGVPKKLNLFHDWMIGFVNFIILWRILLGSMMKNDIEKGTHK